MKPGIIVKLSCRHIRCGHIMTTNIGEVDKFQGVAVQKCPKCGFFTMHIDKSEMEKMWEEAIKEIKAIK